MPWSNGIFTRVYDWVQDALDGLNIEAERVGGEDDNFAAGINACLTKDGSNSPTANLPMAGRRHTGVASPTERNQYMDMASLQDGKGIYGGVSTGTADAYEIEVSPPITAYVQGMALRFKAHVDCNADATIDVNGVGARPLEVEQAAIVDGEIVTDGMYGIFYDGTSFQLLASGGESSSSFVALRDTPDDYTDQKNKIIVVNDDEDAVEFVPRFRGAAIESVEGTDDWSIAAGASLTIPMSSEIVDNLGMHPLSNPERLTVPTGYAGLWEINWALAVYWNQALSAYIRVMIRKNGVNEDIMPIGSSFFGGSVASATIVGQSGSGLITLAEADYITMSAWNLDGSYQMDPAWEDPFGGYSHAASLSMQFLGA